MSSVNRRGAVAAISGFGAMAGAAGAWAAERRAGRSQNRAATDAVRAPILAYFQGHATGDPAYFRKAFLPTARIEGNRQGKFVSWTLDDYCALFKGAPAADERLRTRRIDSADVVGDAAMAKATLDHVATVFTDYFILLRVDGEWRIANKVYTARTKA